LNPFELDISCGQGEMGSKEEEEEEEEEEEDPDQEDQQDREEQPGRSYYHRSQLNRRRHYKYDAVEECCRPICQEQHYGSIADML